MSIHTSVRSRSARLELSFQFQILIKNSYPSVKKVKMKTLICILAALLCLESISGQSSGTMEDRLTLRRELFADYDKLVLPENVTLHFNMALLNLDVDVERNVFETLMWGRYFWNDERLAWDDSKTTVGVLRVDSDEVWKPDMTLYNSANLANMSPCGKSQVLIYPSGGVLWVPPCTYRSMCDTSPVRHNRKNKLTCDLKFGSWVHDGFSMDLQFYNNVTNVDMEDYKGFSDWKIVQTSGERVTKYYDCCAEPYITIEYKFDIERKPVPLPTYNTVQYVLN